jgi:hypothetical protein
MLDVLTLPENRHDFRYVHGLSELKVDQMRL